MSRILEPYSKGKPMKRGSWSWKYKRRQAKLCLCGDHGWVVLTRGFIALFSVRDLEIVNQSTWSALGKGALIYARRGSRGRTTFLHRSIMDEPAGMVIDHANRNPLDNRRENLRVATQSQNMANSKSYSGLSSPYKGVSWSAKDKKWRAAIRDGGKTKFLGNFNTEEAAYAAYVTAGERIFGSFLRAE